ncbi:hypothetical protein [Candidatus Protochlamydia phocaeensis]|nr:hypothetical protein [Candidatus Protochlamydia phocaeensis]
MPSKEDGRKQAARKGGQASAKRSHEEKSAASKKAVETMRERERGKK